MTTQIENKKVNCTMMILWLKVLKSRTDYPSIALYCLLASSKQYDDKFTLKV